MKKQNLKKLSIAALLCIFVVTGFGVYHARNIQIDYNFENFFPPNDSSVNTYRKFAKNFDTEGELILIGIKNNGGIFDSSFLQKIASLSDRIKNQKNVHHVVSPCSECYLHEVAGLAKFQEKPCISFKNLQADSIKIYQNPKLVGSIFSPNESAVTMYVTTRKKLTKSASDELSFYLTSTIQSYDFDETHVAGRIITASYFIEKLKSDLLVFFSISVVLVSFFLWYSFKSLWGVFVPLIIVIFSIIWTIIIMSLNDKSFDLLMVMLPTIVFVVGMSDLIHFLNRFLDELRKGQTKIKAIKISFKEVGIATFLTSSTTAIGFFSLTIVKTIPVKEFGIYSGISVIVAYVLTFIMLPLFLIILPTPKNLLIGKRKENWEKMLSNVFDYVFAKKKIILISFLGIAAISLAGFSQLSVNNFLLEDFKEGDPVKKDFKFFEDHFSGVRLFELSLTAGPESDNIYDFEVAKEIEKIEHYLTHSYTKKGVGFMISPLDPIKYLYSVKHYNNPQYFKLPKREKTYLNQLRTINTVDYDTQVKLVTSDSLMSRISGKIEDVGSLALKKENTKFQQFLQDSINSQLITCRLTGTPVLIDEMNENLSTNILMGLLLAFAVIALIIGLVYKAWIIVIISMAVNTIPLIMVGGIMYALGLDIKISTSLIFTLAFGIAVDDTIHMLSKLKLLLRNGMPLMDALKKSYLTTGKAIIVTSLILCSGFFSLIFSDFVSTQTMGLLISITLFVAVIVDLTLLPLLLASFKNRIKNT